MSGTSKNTPKSTKNASKNCTKKNIQKRARTTLPGPTFWVQNECIFCPEASRGAKNNYSKKFICFGLYADGFFSIFGSPKGSIYKVRGPLFLAIFRLFSTPVHFRLHLGLFEAIFGPSGGAPTVFSWYFLSCRGSRLGHMQGKKGPKRIPQVEGSQRKHCVINSILINPPSRKEYSSRASSVLSPEGWYCMPPPRPRHFWILARSGNLP